MAEEDFDLPKKSKPFVFGMLIIFLCGTFYYLGTLAERNAGSESGRLSPSQIADNIERIMLLDPKEFGASILTDRTSLYMAKYNYFLYKRQGTSRSLLENLGQQICYKRLTDTDFEEYRIGRIDEILNNKTKPLGIES